MQFLRGHVFKELSGKQALEKKPVSPLLICAVFTVKLLFLRLNMPKTEYNIKDINFAAFMMQGRKEEFL